MMVVLPSTIIIFYVSTTPGTTSTDVTILQLQKTSELTDVNQWVFWCTPRQQNTCPCDSFGISLSSNSTTLLWLFRWSPTTRQFTASLIGGHFAARPKPSSAVFLLSWSVQSSCFFSAALIPLIETRSKTTPHRHEPQWLSDFLQEILTKGTARQDVLISRMLYAKQSLISITHSKLSRISVSTAQQTAEHQLSSAFGNCPNITITELPSHKNEVSRNSQRKLLSAARFSSGAKPNFQLLKQTQSCSLWSQTAWSCHCVRLMSCAGVVTNALRGEGFRARPCAASTAHISAFFILQFVSLFQLLSLPQMCHSHDQ